MAYREENNLLSHRRFAIGTIKEIVTYYQNSGKVFIKYDFKLKQRIYNGQTSVVSKNKYKDRDFLKALLINKNFPIVFDSLDPNNSKILLAKKDYENFSIKRPDSLKKYFLIVDSIAQPHN